MSPLKFSHRQILQSLLSGDKLERLPIAFWRHFPVDDQNPQRLADATTFFHNTYNLDIIKVSPSSSFCIRDWGIIDAWNGNIEGTRDYKNSLSLDEASCIKPLDPKSGNLGNQLSALRIIAERHIADTPVIQTIFSPLSQLKNLLGKQNLNDAIRHAPAKVQSILEIITETTSRFLEECKGLQIDGLFFAVQHASSSAMSIEEFLEFGKKFDNRLFGQLSAFRMNVLHIHGKNIYFRQMLDYPCQIINWHDRETAPTLMEASNVTGKVLCGGLSRISTMVKGDKRQIETEITDAISQMSGKNFLLGTGCVLPIIVPHGNLKHAVGFARSQ